MKYLLLLVFGSWALTHVLAQTTDFGELHGNFQIDAQTYRPDSLIGAPDVPERILNNAFLNLTYVRGSFNAGMRYESYLNPLQGFDPRWKGSGIMFRFATFEKNGLEVTAGSFYEQFGNGLILRAYEERGLGFDNFLDGIRLRYMPVDGVVIKGFMARQRNFFDLGPGLLRGVDGEIFINDAFGFSDEAKTKWILGSAFVSRYQVDQNPFYNLPENVGSWATRLNVIRNRWNFSAEYAYKINDPGSTNGFIYRPGQALLVNAVYSKKGLGLVMSVKRLDNMDFRSDRTATGNNLFVNFLPALTRQHTYNLPASIYPYATQPNGEMAYQVELNYLFKKGTPLGGKYGMEVTLNASAAYGLDKQPAANDTFGYVSRFFSVGEEAYFHDYHIEIKKKFNNKWKATAMYLNWLYNKDVVQGLSGFGTIYAHMFVTDVSRRINDKRTLRFETQGLFSKQDEGSWLMGLVELTLSPKWYISLMDQYNYGNPDPNRRIHYLNVAAGYTRDVTRIMLSYGRQREGIFCVGGVCRNMPASNGLLITVVSSF